MKLISNLKFLYSRPLKAVQKFQKRKWYVAILLRGAQQKKCDSRCQALHEDCIQPFIDVCQAYLVEALLEFSKMEDISKLPKENSPFLSMMEMMKKKKVHILAVLDMFVNCGLNLLKSYFILLDCKDAVASGNGQHLVLIPKQMLFYFSSVSGFNSCAIQMLMSIVQNEFLLSPKEAHQCKWAALAN